MTHPIIWRQECHASFLSIGFPCQTAWVRILLRSDCTVIPLGKVWTTKMERENISRTKYFSLLIYLIYYPSGTLRPDLIESASELASGKACAIKTHHNDTELVRELRKQVTPHFSNVILGRGPGWWLHFRCLCAKNFTLCPRLQHILPKPSYNDHFVIYVDHDLYDVEMLNIFHDDTYCDFLSLFEVNSEPRMLVFRVV